MLVRLTLTRTPLHRMEPREWLNFMGSLSPREIKTEAKMSFLCPICTINYRWTYGTAGRLLQLIMFWKGTRRVSFHKQRTTTRTKKYWDLHWLLFALPFLITRMITMYWEKTKVTSSSSTWCRYFFRQTHPTVNKKMSSSSLECREYSWKTVFVHQTFRLKDPIEICLLKRWVLLFSASSACSRRRPCKYQIILPPTVFCLNPLFLSLTEYRCNIASVTLLSVVSLPYR